MSRGRDFQTRTRRDQEKMIWSRLVRSATMTRAHVTRWSWSGFLWSRFWSWFGFWSRVGSRGTSKPVLGSCDSDQRVLVRIRSGVRFKSPVPGQERSGQDPGPVRIPVTVGCLTRTRERCLRIGSLIFPGSGSDVTHLVTQSGHGCGQDPVRSGSRSGQDSGLVSIPVRSRSGPNQFLTGRSRSRSGPVRIPVRSRSRSGPGPVPVRSGPRPVAFFLVLVRNLSGQNPGQVESGPGWAWSWSGRVWSWSVLVWSWSGPGLPT